MTKVKLIFFITCFLMGFGWLCLVPIWHTPDEQAHFSQVAFLVENGRNAWSTEMDVTKEIYVTEQLLGTARDRNGNNKFTFHPEFKIEYTDSSTGKYEASISALTSTNAKNVFVFQESTRYPLSYYIPATWIYKYFYNKDIFIKVFAIRIWSLFLFIFNILVIYKLGELLFPKNKFLALTTAILVGFQPMMVFSNIGVTSDSLANFIFSLFIYLCLRLIMLKVNLKNVTSLIFVSYLAINTKIQFIIILPIIIFLFLFLTLREIKDVKKKILVIVALIFIASGLFIYLKVIKFDSFIFALSSLKKININSLLKYTWEYTFPHTYKEVIPWYWGVYDWLGVTYPRIVYKIINGITLVSITGFIFWFISVLHRRLWSDRNIQGVFLLLGISLFYYLAISVYDWLSWYQSGFQLGVQGRYFFPTISVHMVVIIIGIKNLTYAKYKLQKGCLLALGLLMIIFNFLGLYTIAKTYYDVINTQRFVWQIGQYKPFFAKAPYIISLFFLYFLILILFLHLYIKLYKNEKN